MFCVVSTFTLNSQAKIMKDKDSISGRLPSNQESMKRRSLDLNFQVIVMSIYRVLTMCKALYLKKEVVFKVAMIQPFTV